MLWWQCFIITILIYIQTCFCWNSGYFWVPLKHIRLEINFNRSLPDTRFFTSKATGACARSQSIIKRSVLNMKRKILNIKLFVIVQLTLFWILMQLCQTHLVDVDEMTEKTKSRKEYAFQLIEWEETTTEPNEEDNQSPTNTLRPGSNSSAVNIEIVLTARSSCPEGYTLTKRKTCAQLHKFSHF